ncbi:MAG: thiol-disulfide oxidoreductase DCC family protein [Ilumatobacteraceae bacterium]
MSRSSSPDLGVLVFDGECDFCRRCVKMMRRHLHRQPSAAAWQEANLTELGLNPEECRQAVQWVSERRGNQREQLSAHDAVARVLRNAGGGWSAVGVVMMFPGAHWVSGVVYRWVARNRSRL